MALRDVSVSQEGVSSGICNQILCSANERARISMNSKEASEGKRM